MYEGTEHEFVTQQAVFSRRGTDRIMKYAFEFAKGRKHHVTSCTKSNLWTAASAQPGVALRAMRAQLA